MYMSWHENRASTDTLSTAFKKCRR